MDYNVKIEDVIYNISVGDDASYNVSIDGVTLSTGVNLTGELLQLQEEVDLLQASSGNWDSAYSTVASNSATWSAASSGISTWGSIIGTLSDQTDLYNELLQITNNIITLSGDILSNDSDIASINLTLNSSGAWDTTYSTVRDNSGSWALGGGTDVSEVRDASGSWNSTYSTVRDTSGDWNQVYTLTADVAQNASDILSNSGDIITNAENIAQNVIDISQKGSDILSNSGGIITNAENIALNVIDISQNASDILSNSGNIITNAENIVQNVIDIAQNTSDILSNSGDIITNAENVAQNVIDIAQNGGDIITVSGDVITNTENIAQNVIDISQNSSDILTVSGDVITNAENISQNVIDISQNDSDILSNSGDIITNAENIAQNVIDISQNASDINTVSGDVITNAENIALNVIDISQNASDILTVSGDIITNVENIAQNVIDISQNASDILTVSGDVITNAENIAQNVIDISQNASDILTNIGDIITNAENIALNVIDISQNASDIDDLSGEVITNSENISQNANDILTNSGDIITNAGNIAQNVSNINDLSGDWSYLDTGELIYSPTIGYTPTDNTISGHYDGISISLDSNETNIETLSSQVDTNIEDIANNTSAIEANDSDIVNLSSSIDENISDISDLSGSVAFMDYVNSGNFTVSGGIETLSGLTSKYLDLDTNYVNNNGHLAGRLHWNSVDHTLEIDSDIGDVRLQVGQESLIVVYNMTGVDIMDGSCVYASGIYNGRPKVSLAKADNHATCPQKLFITTMVIPNGEAGFAVETIGKVRGIDTSNLSLGNVYLSPLSAGKFTSVRPDFPNYTRSMGGCTISDSVSGEIQVKVIGSPNDTIFDAWDGTCRETIDFFVTSDGSTITGTLQASPSGDITMIFSDGFTTLDCTPPKTIVLTPGTATIPQANYIYIPKDTKVLTASTSEWPTAEHIKIAYVLLRSATETQTEGVLVNQNWNDHIKAMGDNGHLLHISERLRTLGASWEDGVEGTFTTDGTNAYVSTTGGHVYQLHKQTFPAQDTATGDEVNVVNHFTTPYISVDNLNTVVNDALGNSLSNTSFSFVLWGVQNKTGQPCHLMLNLPTGRYSKNFPRNAVNDVSNYSVYNIPNEFKSVGFLIARFTIVISSGVWSLYATEDLRGYIPNSTAGGGGGGGGVTTFAGLTDTPSAYTGQATNLIQVNSGESALEFITKAGLPISTATQSALDLKASTASLTAVQTNVTYNLNQIANIAATSGTWNDTYSTVQNNSGDWGYYPDVSEVRDTSGSWNSTYSTVRDNSGTWEQLPSVTGYTDADLDTISGDIISNTTALDDKKALQSYDNFFVGAGAMVPRDTNGAESTEIIHTSGNLIEDAFAFDASTEEGVMFSYAMPDDWDLGDIKAKVYWDAIVGATPTNTAQWGISVGAYSSGDATDVPLGSEQVTTAQGLTAVGTTMITASTPAITVGGSPALGDYILVQVVGKTDGTITVDTLLKGISIQYRRLTTEPSAW